MRRISEPSSASSRPAVSMMRKLKGPSRASPSRRSRVTPGRSSTSASFWPTRRLKRVDLPTFGRPTMATVAVMAALAALLGRLRRPGVDEGAVDLEPAAQRLRGFAVGRDLVEPAAGGVVIAPLQCGKAEHLARRVAPGTGRRRDALERRLRRSRLGGVEPEHRGAKTGEILQDGGDAAVGGKRVIGLRALGGVALAGLGGEPEAGEKPIAGGRIRRQPAQDLRRFLALSVLVEAERLLVARGGGLGAGALDVLPIAPAADRRDEEHGEPDDQVVVAPPNLGDAVATILLVDLADEFVRLGQETDPFCGPIRKGGRLSQSLRDGERQAPAPGRAPAPRSARHGAAEGRRATRPSRSPPRSGRSSARPGTLPGRRGRGPRRGASPRFAPRPPRRGSSRRGGLSRDRHWREGGRAPTASLRRASGA